MLRHGALFLISAAAVWRDKLAHRLPGGRAIYDFLRRRGALIRFMRQDTPRGAIFAFAMIEIRSPFHRQSPRRAAYRQPIIIKARSVFPG